MTETADERPSRDRRSSPIRIAVAVAAGATIFWVFGLPIVVRVHRPVALFACSENLRGLAVGMLLYVSDHGGAFPTPEKWCDLLVANVEGLSEKIFRCPGTGEGRCHFAMNPKVTSRSASDTVLLFETGGGWNQCGGPELLTMEHHKGCNVAFVDGAVRFIMADEFGGLKWVDESGAAPR